MSDYLNKIKAYETIHGAKECKPCVRSVGMSRLVDCERYLADEERALQVAILRRCIINSFVELVFVSSYEDTS